MNKIDQLNIAHKRVFLRADLNVPLFNGTVVDDSRLKAILATIEYIQKQGGKVVLATHIGRPETVSKSSTVDPQFSTQQLVSWFKKHAFNIEYEPDLKRAILKSKQDFSSILLLENLRFFQGEPAYALRDSGSAGINFAQLLAQLGDLYINDAFGLIHRSDTSVTLLPQQYSVNHKAFGFLVNNEIEHLQGLTTNPQQPFCLVVGGKKIKDKLEYLIALIEKAENLRPHTILIGGALANTFIKSQDVEIGTSYCDVDALDDANKFLQRCKDQNIEVILPVDFIVKKTTAEKVEENHTITIKPDECIVDIGPHSIELFSTALRNAKTIFANGPLGIYEQPGGQNGTLKVLSTIQPKTTLSIAGGGDILAAINQLRLEKQFTFLSTGGGATLAFIASQRPESLRAIESMCN